MSSRITAAPTNPEAPVTKMRMVLLLWLVSAFRVHLFEELRLLGGRRVGHLVENPYVISGLRWLSPTMTASANVCSPDHLTVARTACSEGPPLLSSMLFVVM